MRSGVENNRYYFITVIGFCFFISAFVLPMQAYSLDSIIGWGSNDYGQCTVPSPNRDFNAVSAGVYFSAGLKNDGSVIAWGWNSDGQCDVPTPNTNFKAIATGYGHMIGLKNDGSIVAWGYNVNGECNVPPPNADFKAVAANGSQSIGLKNDGSIVAWGYNGDNLSNVPSPNTSFKAVAIGWNHALGLKNDGSIVAWGRNGYGQCNIPEPNADFKAIAAGYAYSIGLKNDGSIVAWGNNEDGQCDVPFQTADFKAISAGYDFVLGLKNDGSVAGWGYNTSGQCDPPSNNTNFTAISAGTYNSLGIRSSSGGPVYPFGNIPGQKNTKLTLMDSYNVPVTFSLTGAGYGEVSGDANDEVTLYDTDEKSLLTISTPKGQTFAVVSIQTNGSLKGIMAKTTNLSGDITVTGSLGTLTLKEAEGTISIGSPTMPNSKASVTMVFDIAYDLYIDSQMPIKSISATQWHGGSLNAPSVGSITAKGDKKRKLLGELYLDVEVDGNIGTVKAKDIIFGGWICNSIKSISAVELYTTNMFLNQLPDAKVPALGKLKAKYIYNSQIRAMGNIGSVSMGIMDKSSCFAGIAEGITGFPAAEEDSFAETATIKSIAIKGIKGEEFCYINSNIAAANILSASIAYPNTFNDGVPFGITADYIKKLTVKDAEGTESLKELKKQSDVPADLDLGDAEIHLYEP